MKTRIVLLIFTAFASAEECIIGQAIADIQCSGTMNSVRYNVSVEECSEHRDCCILDGECVARRRPNPGCWDIDEKGNPFQVISQSDCNQQEYSDRCCFRNGTCEACNAIEEEDVEGMTEELYYNGTSTIRASYSAWTASLHWLISYVPSPPPECLPPVPFPSNCQPRRNEYFVLEPPVDVPYCLRIPCKANGNEKFETSQTACSMQPGCYFDVALFELRHAFGQSLLPDVPVCHLAIRNEVFQNNAKTVVAEYGSWNPYLTNCLLTMIDDDIREGATGCELLPNLDALYVTPKMAGWKTINSYECALIGGCWWRGRGCFYPPDFSRVRVKEPQREATIPRNENIYGIPRCQVFDPSSSLNILKSYHKCLSSGCAVDSSVTDRYYNDLYYLGMSMTSENHWKYWSDVERGHLGAYNIEAVLGEYGYGELPPTTTIPPLPTTMLDPFNLIFPIPPSMDGGEEGLNNPFGASWFHLYPQSQVDNSDCGPAFKQDGGRPCEPSRIDVGKTSMFSKPCPYRPILVPRFRKLSGKFDGCCDVDLCYLPKEEIPKARTRPSHYYTEWSMFSKCSATCGLGEQKRYRRCISGDRSKCTENLVDVKPCFTRCSSWTTWSRYTPCSRTCYPGGIQTRSRECLSPEEYCAGSGKETRVCNKQKYCRG